MTYATYNLIQVSRNEPSLIITLANQYTQIVAVHLKITHFKQMFGCTFCLITVNLK